MPRGGFRENAGRKGFYGEKTVAVKIPASRVEEVKAFLRGESIDSVTLSKNDLVTETNGQNDSVTVSNYDLVTKTNITEEDLKGMYELWQSSLDSSVQTEKKLQLADNDFKTGDYVQKLDSIQRVITEWTTKCAGKEKSPRWEKAYNLLIKIEEVIAQQSIG